MPPNRLGFIDLMKSSQTCGPSNPPASTAHGGTGQRAVCPDPAGAEDLTDKLFELSAAPALGVRADQAVPWTLYAGTSSSLVDNNLSVWHTRREFGPSVTFLSRAWSQFLCYISDI